MLEDMRLYTVVVDTVEMEDVRMEAVVEVAVNIAVEVVVIMDEEMVDTG